MNKLIIIILLPLLLISCKNEYIEQQLAEAEIQLTENPDSALALLDDISLNEITYREQRAHYALLMKQARDKNYVIETDDSLINIACDYYDNSEDYKNAAMSHFYRARIYSNAGVLKSSMIELLEASRDFDKYDYPWIKAKINDLQSEIYYDYYCYDLSKRHSEMAINDYIKADKVLNAVYCYIDISHNYCAAGNIDSAIYVLDYCQKRFNVEDSTCLACIYKSYIRPLHKSGNNQKAILYFNKTSDYGNNKITNDYVAIASVYLSINKPDSTLYYLNKEIETNGKHIDNEYLNHVFSDYYEYIGDYKSAFKCSEQRRKAQNEKVVDVVTDNISRVVSSYYENQTNEQHIHIGRLNKLILFSGALLIVIFFVICISVYIFRLKNKNNKLIIADSFNKIYELTQNLKQKDAVAKNLEEELDSKDIALMNLSSDLKAQNILVQKLFQKRFEVLDGLCVKFYEANGVGSKQKQILEEFEKAVHDFNTDDSRKQLFEEVNKFADNLIDKIQEQISVTENNLFFIALYASGFSPRAICLIMEIQYGNYYNIWTRLREKITKSDAVDKDLFMKWLEKR